MGILQLVTVRPGDCLWTIAQQHLGSGDRFHEIVALNLGHDMGNGQVFTNPSLIQPGWVLHLPAGPAAAPPRRPPAAGRRRPHRAAATPAARSQLSTPAQVGHPGPGPVARSGQPPARQPSAAPAPASSAPAVRRTRRHRTRWHRTRPAPRGPRTRPRRPRRPRPRPGRAAAGRPAPALPAPVRTAPARPAARPGRSPGTSPHASLTAVPDSRLPLGIAFGTGVLAGGAAASLARLRHRQRQTRRRGRRIPLPASAPVAVAEQRLHVAAGPGVRSRRCAGCSATWPPRWWPRRSRCPRSPRCWCSPTRWRSCWPARPPSLRRRRSRVPGGRQGKAWQLWLDERAARPGRRSRRPAARPAHHRRLPTAATSWLTWSTCRSRPSTARPA